MHSILSKRKSLPVVPNKPDLSRKARTQQSLLLKIQWSLILNKKQVRPSFTLCMAEKLALSLGQTDVEVTGPSALTGLHLFNTFHVTSPGSVSEDKSKAPEEKTTATL